MARPRSKKVDYFPHDCQHGKTLFILEQRYQTVGYAFWFKLLELLGITEGHFIDCSNPDAWEFLQAKTFTTEIICQEILDLLARLRAIDPELWQAKVIWSQNFVNRLASVYTNRRVEMPTRPDNYTQKPHGVDVSTPQNTQSKVKESKGKESKSLEGDFWEKSPWFPLAKRILENAKKNNPTLDKGAGYDETKKLATFAKDLSLLHTRTWPHLTEEEAVKFANDIWDWAVTYEGADGYRWSDNIESGYKFYLKCSPHLKDGGTLISKYYTLHGKTPAQNRGVAAVSKPGTRTFPQGGGGD